MNRTCLRLVAMAMITGTLSACGALGQSQIFQPSFWSFPGSKVNDNAELGIAAMSKGDNVQAQGYFDLALKANPSDVHALYGLALVYQNTGQPSRARQLYEQILAIRPVPIDEMLIWADKRTHPIIDIAQVNLQLLSSGGMVQTDGVPPQMSSAPTMTQPMPPSMRTQQPQRPTQNLYATPAFGYGAQPAPMAATPMFKEADLNIVARFNTMRALLDQGLITQDEFLLRRKVNVGSLLPLTSAPAATGLDRPVPAIDQVSGRLRAIGRALEMRALTPAQHTAERTMIIDALMPKNPAARQNPLPPPRGLMEAADAVRRLELLQNADLITSDEYAKERAAIEGSMQPAGTVMPMSQNISSHTLDSGEGAGISGFQPAVHLASYRQKKSALRGWASLQKRFKSQLGGLETSIERVDLGGGKGVFYRLKAGPLPSNNAAVSLCRKLKSKRQYCDPTTINFG